MGKILCYVYEDMADYEVTLTLHSLHNLGKKTIVSVSEHKKAVRAQSGMKYTPQMLISEAMGLTDVDGLILPGGPIRYDQNEICPLIRSIAGRGALIAAIGNGPQFLSRSDILGVYLYTTSCTPEVVKKEQLPYDPFHRKNYVEQRVSVDRNVITAKGYAFVDFAEAICEYFDLFESEEQKQELIGRTRKTK